MYLDGDSATVTLVGYQNNGSLWLANLIALHATGLFMCPAKSILALTPGVHLCATSGHTVYVCIHHPNI